MDQKLLKKFNYVCPECKTPLVFKELRLFPDIKEYHIVFYACKNPKCRIYKFYMGFYNSQSEYNHSIDRDHNIIFEGRLNIKKHRFNKKKVLNSFNCKKLKVGV